jgi:hypothetical protein
MRLALNKTKKTMPHLIKHLHEDDDVLHVIASGPMNLGETASMWDHMQTLAHEHNAKRILIECAASCGRISMTHCFDLIERIPFMSRHLACKIAMLEQHMSDEAHDLLRFIETSVTDRGAHFKLFRELEEAKLWLKK